MPNSQAHTPHNHILDGGTGSNGMTNTLLMLSKSSENQHNE